MNLALWIVTGVLAAAYFFGGGGKLVLSKQKIAATGHSAASRGWPYCHRSATPASTPRAWTRSP